MLIPREAGRSSCPESPGSRCRALAPSPLCLPSLDAAQALVWELQSRLWPVWSHSEDPWDLVPILWAVPQSLCFTFCHHFLCSLRGSWSEGTVHTDLCVCCWMCGHRWGPRWGWQVCLLSPVPCSGSLWFPAVLGLGGGPAPPLLLFFCSGTGCLGDRPASPSLPLRGLAVGQI